MEVVAALICEQGRVLVGQRPANKACANLWEFVGGKVEPGESLPQALERECQEELGVRVQVGKPWMDLTHEYPTATVHLTVLYASIPEGEPLCLEHQQLQWLAVDELDKFEFCPADQEILTALKTTGWQLPERDIPAGYYRHFKNLPYQVLGTALHSETCRPMIVYRALYGAQRLWVRPHQMFAGLVDKEKYPSATQTERFAYVGQEPFAPKPEE